MRVAHITDIHWFSAPPLSRMWGKRMLGTANLYLRNRRDHFTRDVQQALVQHVIGLDPDLVIITGDLTAQALPEEFALARADLDGVLTRFPTFVIPGNHDVYTGGAQRSRRIRDLFGPWMHLGDRAVARLDLGEITVLGLDPNRATWVNASGFVPPDQLVELAEDLKDPALADRFVILALHYPILDRHGEVYEGSHHGLLNARELIKVLERAAKKPDLVIFGHQHHGYRTELSIGNGVPLMNCGSSGYAYQPEKRRAAGMNLYEVAPGHLEVERYLYDGHGFSPEPGGAYATGR